MRSKNGNVYWQVGHATLKKARKTGPASSSSARVLSPPLARSARRKSGARSPAVSVWFSWAEAITLVEIMEAAWSNARAGFKLFVLMLLDEVQNVEAFEF